MAKQNKSIKSSSATSNTKKTRSSKSTVIQPAISKSTLKGVKTRDRKDVENMNDLNAIGELQTRLSTSKRNKQSNTDKTRQVTSQQGVQHQQQSTGELADSLAKTL